jgi:hypothetical protein
MRKRRYYYQNKRVSKGEYLAAKLLEQYNIDFKQEYSYDDLVSDKNRKLRFDFKLDNQDILIEIQGQHHYFPVNKYRKALIVHNKTKYHDSLKKQYCQDHNLKLIEISYKEFDKIEDILIEQLGL